MLLYFTLFFSVILILNNYTSAYAFIIVFKFVLCPRNQWWLGITYSLSSSWLSEQCSKVELTFKKKWPLEGQSTTRPPLFDRINFAYHEARILIPIEYIGWWSYTIWEVEWRNEVIALIKATITLQCGLI